LGSIINKVIEVTRNVRQYLHSLSVDLHDIKNAVQSIDENAKASQDKQRTPEVVIAEVHEPKAVEDEHRAHRDGTKRRDIMRLAIEGLTLLSVTFYGYMAVRQWREQISARHQTQGAIAAALRSASAAETANNDARTRSCDDERPYVWVKGGELGTPQFVSATNSNVGQISWTFHFTNYGHSPANNIMFTEKQIQVGVNSPFRRSYGLTKDKMQAKTPVAPTQDEITTVLSEEIQQSEVLKLSKIDQGITIRATMRYDDSCGRPHETGICLSTLVNGTTVFCSSGNYIH
jgi:hypothetical protein